MIRGTTPKLEFTLPFEVDQISEAFITFVQRDKVVLEKSISECSVGEKTL